MIIVIGSNAENIRGNAEKNLWKIIQSDWTHRPALTGLSNNIALQNSVMPPHNFTSPSYLTVFFTLCYTI